MGYELKEELTLKRSATQTFHGVNQIHLDRNHTMASKEVSIHQEREDGASCNKKKKNHKSEKGYFKMNLFKILKRFLHILIV